MQFARPRRQPAGSETRSVDHLQAVDAGRNELALNFVDVLVWRPDSAIFHLAADAGLSDQVEHGLVGFYFFAAANIAVDSGCRFGGLDEGEVGTWPVESVER